MKFKAFLIACAIMMQGCTLGPYVSQGWLFSNVKGPVTATGVKYVGKRGVACAHGLFFGMIAFGDNSIGAAARARGIKTISHVDYESFNLLGIYYNSCTIVGGGA